MNVFDSIRLAWWKRHALNAFVTGHYDIALKYFGEIKNRWRDFPGIDYNLGLTTLALGHFHDAEEHLLKARETDPSYPVLRALGDIYYLSGNSESAIEIYKQAKKDAPGKKDTNVLEKRLATCRDPRSYEKAMAGWKAFDQAIDLEKKGKQDEAAGYYSLAIEADETNFVAANNLGGYYMNRQSDYARALSCFLKADALADHPVVKTNIAKLRQLETS